MQHINQLQEEARFTKNGYTRIVYYYMGKGCKISAIKSYRKMTGMGLKDSKDWVEAEMDRLKQL